MPQAMSNKEVQHQLRRIGEAATKSNVQDIMILNREVTKFGRRADSVTYYVDSSRLVNMISRLHAEVHCKYHPDHPGHYLYFIEDRSLNGTYVNDTRVLNSVQLKEGDIIIFGHINGVSIKPGEYSKQKKSEFKFVFERQGAEADSTSAAGRKRSSSGSRGTTELQSKKKNKPSNIVLKDLSSNMNSSRRHGYNSDEDSANVTIPGGLTSPTSSGRVSGGRGSGGGGRSGSKSGRGKRGGKGSGRGESAGGDGVTYEYTEEPCESDNCQRPTGSTVDWVQCDDCDKWYHTECVGLDLQELKDEDTFHCGCS